MSSDTDIRREIENELTWEPTLNQQGIMVQVHEGVVTLGGTAPHYADAWTAEQVAQRVSGVSAVANDIEVVMPKAGERQDPDITEAAIEALKWHFATEKCSILPVVCHGWIQLTGEVESAHQRSIAESAVRYLAGVKSVTNDIVVKPVVQLRVQH